jgi:mono/diheme cytochrome c family protein
MTLSRIISLSATILAAGLLGLSAARADDSAAAAHGFQLFMANNCYQCHGTVGQGGGNGPTIAPPRLRPQANFMAFVRQPPGMPPFTTAVLDDNDLAAIWTYLNSLPAPSSSLPEPLARLQQPAAH